jgi:hypothetical protein
LFEDDISQRAYVRTWNDQTGNGYDAVGSNVYPYIIGNKYLAQLNAVGSGFENLRIPANNLLQNRGKVTIFMVMSEFFTQGHWLIGLNIIGTVSSNLLKLEIRRVSTDAYTQLFSIAPIDETRNVVCIDIDYVNGTCELLINGISNDSGVLATSGNSQNVGNLIAFDRGAGGSGGLVNAVYPLYRFQISENLTISEVNSINDNLIARYRPSLPLQTGNEIYNIFDGIWSLDRYSNYPYAANVRESGGNTSEIISHGLDGLFDVTAFNTHVGVNNGFAITIINQQYPTQILNQATAARQLQIVPNYFNGHAAFLGNNAARRSIQGTFPIATKALHYYWFVVAEITALPTVRFDFFAQRSGTGANLRMIGGVTVVSGNLRTKTFQKRVSGDVLRENEGTENLALDTKYLLSYHFDYENGIVETFINSVIDINDTSAYSGSEIEVAVSLCIGNVADNSTVGVSGYLLPPLLVQGEISTAQREEIERVLMLKYGIS